MENTNVSWIDSDGRIIFYCLEQFMNDIVKGDCCFVCGLTLDEIEFTNEHIIPNWILRKFNLHGKKITLPNGTKFRYDQYVVPCCIRCNSDLNEVYESQLSLLFDKPFEAIVEELKNDEALVEKIFVWMCLIYIKTHLKDKELLMNRDKRKDEGKIADNFYWEDFHHIHCVSRTHHTGFKLDKGVVGTYILLKSIKDNDQVFDYLDSPFGKTMMIQLGDVVLIANLSDSKAGEILWKDVISQFKFPLNTSQFREIIANLNGFYLNLKERPKFYSTIENGQRIIKVRLPDKCELESDDQWRKTTGELLRAYAEDWIVGEDREELLKQIEVGKRTFLFDENGRVRNYKTNTDNKQ